MCAMIRRNTLTSSSRSGASRAEVILVVRDYSPHVSRRPQSPLGPPLRCADPIADHRLGTRRAHGVARRRAALSEDDTARLPVRTLGEELGPLGVVPPRSIHGAWSCIARSCASELVVLAQAPAAHPQAPAAAEGMETSHSPQHARASREYRQGRWPMLKKGDRAPGGMRLSCREGAEEVLCLVGIGAAQCAGMSSRSGVRVSARAIANRSGRPKMALNCVGSSAGTVPPSFSRGCAAVPPRARA